MILLDTTAKKLQLVTSAAADIDVNLSWVDMTTADPPVVKGSTSGSAEASVTTAATTDICAAPGASTVRNVKHVSVRNAHASTPCVVTVVKDVSGTDYELYKATLAAGDLLTFTEGTGWFHYLTSAPGTPPWDGAAYPAFGYGGNLDQWLGMLNAHHAAPVNATPTNISTTVARCCGFVLPKPLVVNNLRYWSLAAVAATYSVAIYRYSDLARLTAQIDFDTPGANQWAVANGAALNLSLAANTLYFLAVSARTTGTTAGVGCCTIAGAANTPQRVVTPGAHPGSLTGTAVVGSLFQFAVTAGALPATAATLAVQAAWTGGMPAFLLDNA